MSANVSFIMSEDVTLIHLSGAPSDMCFFASLFDALSSKGINVDMISQNPPQGAASSLSFTISDNDLRGALDIVAELRGLYPGVKTSVSSENAKILVTSEDMREHPGFAAKVFQAAALCAADVRMVTTSEIDMSLLVPASNAAFVLGKIREVFE